MLKTKTKKDPESKPIHFNQIDFLLIGSLLLVTSIIFSECLKFKFINYDDPQYITGNALIRDLSFDGIVKLFTTPIIGMYNPLPFLVYAFEYSIWGYNPKYFHLVNLMFHLIAIITVYAFTRRLSGDKIVAIIVAFFFALHPMHISVVVWASQLKTSMYLIFYFLSLIIYLDFKDRNKTANSTRFIFWFYLCALLSKPSAVTLPLVMLLVDWYKDGKLNKNHFIEKTSLFILAGFFAIVTLLTHKNFGDNIFEVQKHYSFINQLLIANYSIVFYIEKFFLPINLSSIYPYPEVNVFLPLKYYLAIPVIPILIFLIIKGGSFKKEILFGILFFIIALTPLLRLVPSGDFAYANRYSYLSYTGPIYVLAMFILYLRENRIKKLYKWRGLIYGVLLSFSIFCVWNTINRIKVWESTISLFTDIISKYPTYYKAYNQRGMSLVAAGDYVKSLKDLTTSIGLNPKHADTYNDRALIYMEIGKFADAKRDLLMAVQLDSNSFQAWNNLAKCELSENNVEVALEYLSKSIKSNDAYKEAYLNRAMVRLFLGDSVGAFKDAVAARDLGFKEAKKFINENFGED